MDSAGVKVTAKKVTLYIRDTEKKESLPMKSLSKIKDFGKAYDERLKKKADNLMSDRIVNCKSKDDLKKALNSGKVGRVNFCSVDKSGEKCAEHIEKDLGAEVRGTMANKSDKPTANSKCIICNSPAKEVVYVGRSY